MQVVSIDLNSEASRALEIASMTGGRDRHTSQFMGPFVQCLYAAASATYEIDGREVFGKDAGYDMHQFYEQGVPASLKAWDRSLREGFICC